MVLAGVVVAIIIVAAAGYYFFTLSTTTSSSTTSTGTLVPTSRILTGLISGGFYNSQVVTFGYSQNYTCLPTLIKLFTSNSTETSKAAASTPCGVGAGDSKAVASAAPVFILVPAYAGLSIFGVPALGATSQGYSAFNGNVIFTQCGAGGTTSSCADHPTLVYSPLFTAVEQFLGIKGGYGGLPEGVLPVPSHSHVVNYVGGTSIPWDVITVLVFDPNIMPDGATGKCQKVVASELSNPTGNCLTSFSALSSALTTTTTATANANKSQSNPIYNALGGVKTQIVIPGVSVVSDNSPTNTNIFLYFNVQNKNPFP